MTFDDLMRAVLAILPDAQLEQDNDGQIIVYTGMKLDGEKVFPYDGETDSAYGYHQGRSETAYPGDTEGPM